MTNYIFFNFVIAYLRYKSYFTYTAAKERYVLAIEENGVTVA